MLKRTHLMPKIIFLMFSPIKNSISITNPKFKYLNRKNLRDNLQVSVVRGKIIVIHEK